MLAMLFGSTSAVEKDRRRAARQRIDAPGELMGCRADARTPSLPVEVRDLSTTGVGIVHEFPLPVGQKYVVKQEALAPDQPRLYTVVRSDTTPNGCYGIGLHASNLLDPHVERPAPRRRDGARAAVVVTASIVFIITVAALMLY